MTHARHSVVSFLNYTSLALRYSDMVLFLALLCSIMLLIY